MPVQSALFIGNSFHCQQLLLSHVFFLILIGASFSAASLALDLQQADVTSIAKTTTTIYFNRV